jgi:hypothetical protein
MRKIGRNDPCPCGSKKKYKHCCLRKNRDSTGIVNGKQSVGETAPEEKIKAAELPAGLSAQPETEDR